MSPENRLHTVETFHRAPHVRLLGFAALRRVRDVCFDEARKAGAEALYGR
jgi:hypothetical protein